MAHIMERSCIEGPGLTLIPFLRALNPKHNPGSFLSFQGDIGVPA